MSMAAIAASTAHADGYYEGTKGARAAGRAGAFTARADDISAVLINPAGLTHRKGTLLHIGNRFSHNMHRYKRAPTLDYAEDDQNPPRVRFDTVNNDAPFQLVDPLLGVSTDFGQQDFRFAFAIIAPPGIGRERYPVSGGQRYMMASRNAQMIDYVASVAWQPSDNFGLGVSLVWIAVPSLTYQLVVDGHFSNDAYPVSSPYDMLTTVDGSDLFTPNLILGGWYRPKPFLEIAISGQVLPTQIVTNSTLDIQPLSGNEQVQLSRPGQPKANDVNLTLPLPITARAGVRYIHLQGARELFDIELDATFEGWSAVDQFTLSTHGMVATYENQRINLGNIVVPKRWRNTFNLLLGGDYNVLANLLTLRGGLFYETAVAPAAYANVDFVSGRQLGGALGASLYIGNVEVALAYVLRYAPKFTVSERQARGYQQVPLSGCQAPYTDTDLCDQNYLGQPAPVANAGTYSARSNIIALDVLYHF